jgi:hypothetical protein
MYIRSLASEAMLASEWVATISKLFKGVVLQFLLTEHFKWLCFSFGKAVLLQKDSFIRDGKEIRYGLCQRYLSEKKKRIEI